mgnify:CR=1 FL=1
MKVMIVEDDAQLAQSLSDILTEAGYLTEVARDGAEAEFRGATEIYAAVVLDLGLPGMAGIDVLRAWRATGHAMPVLILTARSDWSDKIAGFRAGADDYVVKPVRLEEVLLRVQSLIRRAAGHATMDLSAGPLQLDVQTGLFTLDGRALRLTAFEQRLLSLLMHHKGRIVSRATLSEQLYDGEADRDFRSIEVVIGRLRRKIAPARIETHRGRGYALVDGDAEPGA